MSFAQLSWRHQKGTQSTDHPSSENKSRPCWKDKNIQESWKRTCGWVLYNMLWTSESEGQTGPMWTCILLLWMQSEDFKTEATNMSSPLCRTLIVQVNSEKAQMWMNFYLTWKFHMDAVWTIEYQVTLGLDNSFGCSKRWLYAGNSYTIQSNFRRKCAPQVDSALLCLM